MAPMHSYCIIHPGSQLNDGKFQYDSTQVKIEVPSGDPSGDPYDDSGIGAGSGEEDVIVFDHVFPPKTSQEDVFQDIAKVHVLNALRSFQSAIFIASGASGSGKTFAVTGGAQRFSDRGLIPRSVSALFEAMAAETEREDVEVSVSFYELYKDAVVDLLSDRRRKVPIKPTQSGPQLIGLLRQVVSTESDAYHLLFQGDSNRHFQSCAQNSETSRGHVFYLLHVNHCLTGKRAVLAFVDLAAPIAVRNPANTAIAQSIDALKATLLALRDGREAFWESATLPQLLEPWLGRKSQATVVLLSPVKYSSELHTEAHEWLTFTRLTQEAYTGKPPPYSQLQKNWFAKDEKAVQNGLQLPVSFQEPGVEVKEEEKKKEEAKMATEKQSQVSQVSQVSYPQLPSQTSICSHSNLPSQASLPSQSSGRMPERNGTVTSMPTETDAQKASSQASERDSKPEDLSPEGPRFRVEGSTQTPPGSGRRLVKALSPSMNAQVQSGMVTPPPPVSMKPVSPLPGARSPIAVAIDVLRDGAGDRMIKAFTQPASPENRPVVNGAAMPTAQAMPPPRHLSPLRHIMTKQVSVSPPATSPAAGSPSTDAANHTAPGRVPQQGTATPTAPPPAPGMHVQRPSTLAVQHQQKEMQYVTHNLKRHVPLQGTQQGTGPFVGSPSPPGGRAVRNAGGHAQATAEATAAVQPQQGGYASPMVHMAPTTSFVPQAGTRISAPSTAPTVLASGARTPFAAYGARTESPMAYQAQARSVSPMARPLPVTAATPMRYGAFVQPYQVAPQAQPMQAMPSVHYSAVMMGREMVRPMVPQVPVAFKVAPAAPQAAVVKTPRKAGTDSASGSQQPSRNVSPLPAGTMERVVRARQESK